MTIDLTYIDLINLMKDHSYVICRYTRIEDNTWPNLAWDPFSEEVGSYNFGFSENNMPGN